MDMPFHQASRFPSGEQPEKAIALESGTFIYAENQVQVLCKFVVKIGTVMKNDPLGKI